MLCGKENERKEEMLVEGVFRRILCEGERIQLTRLTMQRGTPVPEHSHPHEQAGYVIDGRFEVVIGGERSILTKGSYFRIPSGVPHSGFVHENTELLDVYSPPKN